MKRRLKIIIIMYISWSSEKEKNQTTRRLFHRIHRVFDFSFAVFSVDLVITPEILKIKSFEFDREGIINLLAKMSFHKFITLWENLSDAAVLMFKWHVKHEQSNRNCSLKSWFAIHKCHINRHLPHIKCSESQKWRHFVGVGKKQKGQGKAAENKEIAQILLTSLFERASLYNTFPRLTRDSCQAQRTTCYPPPAPTPSHFYVTYTTC